MNFADVPSAPKGPLAIDVRLINEGQSNQVSIGWNESESDGGAQILEYSLEMKEVSAFLPYAQQTWQELAQVQPKRAMTHTAENLTPATSYRFRVCAKNFKGCSEWLESSQLIHIAKPPGTLESY